VREQSAKGNTRERKATEKKGAALRHKKITTINESPQKGGREK
jgi:hypothetical protein